MSAPRQPIRFGPFEADPTAGELRRAGTRIKLQDQPFRILTILLSRPGEVVTREELREQLWPDGTFVEFEHSLNTSINKLRRALNDSADTPRYIETVPRRGYRFVGEIDRAAPPPSRRRIVLAAVIAAAVVLTVVVGWWLSRLSGPRTQYTLRQLTFDSGVTRDPMISADGKFVVYASDRAGDGNLDIWMQQIGADAAIQLTDHPARDHEPSFSADGQLIVFASARDGGGIYVKPALGGAARLVYQGSGQEPRFSPDGKWISFSNYGGPNSGAWVVPSEGGNPIELHPDDPRTRNLILTPPIWLPDGAGVLTGSNGQENWLILSPDGKIPIRTGLHQDWLVKRGFEWRIRAGAVDWYLMRPEAWWAARDRVIFTATHGASTNLWSVPLSLATGKVTGEPERLTTGAGPDVCPSVARNGRIVFSDPSANLNVVSVPLDANTGEVTGPLESLTSDLAKYEFPVVSPDGRKIAYHSDRSGGHDIWIHDLETGDRQALTDLGDLHWQGGVAFSPDSSEVAFSRKQDAIYIVSAKGGVPRKVVAEAWGVRDWSPDGEKLLIGRRVLDISTGELTELFEQGAHDPRVSPDGRWVAFHAFAGPDRRQIRVAPFRPDRTTPVDEGIPITDGESNEYRAAWSPDGNLLYFSSARDGHNCIWAQRLDPQTKQPAGPPFEVYGFHETTPTLASRSHGIWLSVASDRIVFNIARISGNIWMLEPMEEDE
ncbi:MAG: hypothetical protein GY953_53205 [bacterium]|nr:hypothetical protein [bacterium]